jgi:hypothetical protein
MTLRIVFGVNVNYDCFETEITIFFGEIPFGCA